MGNQIMNEIILLNNNDSKNDFYEILFDDCPKKNLFYFSMKQINKKKIFKKRKIIFE